MNLEIIEAKPKPRRTPECKWTHCTASAIGGAFVRESDGELGTLPLCQSHLFAVSYEIWSRKEPA